jgi:hypothetical protein
MNEREKDQGERRMSVREDVAREILGRKRNARNSLRRDGGLQETGGERER